MSTLHSNRFRVSVLIITLCAIIISSIGFAAAQGPTSLPFKPGIKNVIVLVFDGGGSAHVTLARWYKGAPLALDNLAVGGIRTYCANSIITDSAPAATAFATGYKTDSKCIGVLPNIVDVPKVKTVNCNDAFRPVATVLEAAKLMGKSTGMIATANIQHATPASFSAHWPNRNDYCEIAEQQVYQNIDVVFGGGKQYLLPAAKGGARADNTDLVTVLKKNGYDFVENTAQMKASPAARIWGMFADTAMAYDIDRNPAREPSLAEMTHKALRTLVKNPKGFFLFVEGSKVDWASHANEPIGVISDLLAFDQAVKTAVDFAKTRNDTLVLAFSDHSNGGLSIGSAATDKNYDNLKPDAVLGPLKKAHFTGEGLEKRFTPDKSNLREVMANDYGISDLTPAEVNAIKAARPGSLIRVVGPMLSKRANLGWTTTGHTGEDVFLYAYGINKPLGIIDNTEIPKIIDRVLGLNLAAANRKLFWNASALKAPVCSVRRGSAFARQTYGPNKPVVVLVKGKHTAHLPVNTNEMYINNQLYRLNGLTLIINGVSYVPQQAISRLNGLK